MCVTIKQYIQAYLRNPTLIVFHFKNTYRIPPNKGFLPPPLTVTAVVEQMLGLTAQHVDSSEKGLRLISATNPPSGGSDIVISSSQRMFCGKGLLTGSHNHSAAIGGWGVACLNVSVNWGGLYDCPRHKLLSPCTTGCVSRRRTLFQLLDQVPTAVLDQGWAITFLGGPPHCHSGHGYWAVYWQTWVLATYEVIFWLWWYNLHGQE